VDMSEENVARLRTLLATVSRTIIVGPGMASSLPASGPQEPLPSPH
jgi:hypothetical protein